VVQTQANNTKLTLNPTATGASQDLCAVLDITAEVRGSVESSGVTSGACVLWSMHTTAGLTVNEYETLLMKHDLAEVLRDPLQFMARKGRNMLRDPGAIPNKAKNYAKYDLVRLVNRVVDTLGLSESLVERIIDKCLAVPAERFLRMKRSVSLLVTEDTANGEGTIEQGRYQSPILVQWRKSAPQTRRLRARLTRFE